MTLHPWQPRRLAAIVLLSAATIVGVALWRPPNPEERTSIPRNDAPLKANKDTADKSETAHPVARPLKGTGPATLAPGAVPAVPSPSDSPGITKGRTPPVPLVRGAPGVRPAGPAPGPAGNRPSPPPALAAAEEEEPLPPFVAPTPEQMRDQPSATTAAQILSQRLNLSDPAVEKEVTRLLTLSYETRKKAAWERAAKMGLQTRGISEGGGYFELEDFDARGRPVYVGTDNVNAAISTAADHVRAQAAYAGVDGTGMTIGVWDVSGVRATHQEFNNGGVPRLVVQDGSVSVNGSGDHATHVSATIAGAGVNPLLRGMAPGAQVKFWDFADDIAEMTAAASGLWHDGKLLVGNGSYGVLMGWDRDKQGNWFWYGTFSNNGNNADDVEDQFGQYNDHAAALDGLVFNKPYFLQVRAAGNERTNGPPPLGAVFTHVGADSFFFDAECPRGDGRYANGYDTIGAEKTAKNILTVGAVTDAVTGGSRDHTVAVPTTFSSWGPADDGRIKPDIVANGHQLLSAGQTADDDTKTMSGTSMATPNVSGSALLLQQLYMALEPNDRPMLAATLKGLIIHTADNLGPIGPDYQTGWGLMNTKVAADTIKAHFNGQNGAAVIEDRVTSAKGIKTYKFAWDGSKPLRATLCWTDPPGEAEDSHDNGDGDLINDLELIVLKSDNSAYQPYVMPYALGTGGRDLPAVRGTNRYDNVEQVFLPIVEVTPDTYTVNVFYDGELKDGRQDFSLIITGCLPPAEIAVETSEGRNLRDEVDTVSFGSAPPGETKQQTFTIKNLGQGMMSNLSVTCDGPHASQFTISQPAGTVEGEDEATFTVTFTPAAGNPPERNAVLHIESNDPDENPFDFNITARAEPAADVAKAWSHKVNYPDGAIEDSLVTIDPAGNVIAAGLFDSPIPNDQGFKDLHLFKYATGTGEVMWQKVFDGPVPPYNGYQYTPLRVETDSAGNVYLGVYHFHYTQGGGPYIETFRVVKYAPDGTLLWQVGGPQDHFAYDMKLDADGNVIVLSDTFTAGFNDFEPVITKLASANGAQLWRRQVATFYGKALAVDGDGNAIVTGTSDLQVHVEKFAAANGATQWEKDFTPPGSAFDAWGDSISANAAGDVAVHCTYYDNGADRSYIVRLDGSDGDIVWATQDGMSLVLDTLYRLKRSVNIGPDGKVITVYSDANVTSIKKYDGGPAPVWTAVIDNKTNPNPGERFIIGHIVFDPLGNPVVSGHDGNGVQWITAKYAISDGALLWRTSHVDENPNGIYAQPFVTSSQQSAVAAGPGGRVAVTGTLRTSPYTQPPVMQTILYATNAPPEVETDANSHFITVNESQTGTITATGTFSDANGNESVTLTATRNGQPFGVLGRNDTAGTWTWTLNPSDGPDHSGFVVITADDAISEPVTASISLTVQNVAPFFDAGADVSLTPLQAASFSRGITFTDPAADVWTATVDYGDGTPAGAVTVNQGSKSFTLSHNYAQPGVYPVTVTVRDGDTAGSFTDTFNVTVQRLIPDWRMTHFGQSANSGEAANDADPDNDGVKNAVEFALGSDPNSPGSLILPKAGMTASDPDEPQSAAAESSVAAQEEATLSPTHLSMVFAEPPGTTGVTYGAEYSTDLVTWQPVTDTGEDGFHVFSVPIGTNTRMFMRLVITVP